MTTPTEPGVRQGDDEAAATIAEDIAEICARDGVTVAVAESLTTGRIVAHLGAAPGASGWLRGGLVAYADEVKHGLLDVPRGPVVSAEAAQAMALGVAKLLGADIAVSVTGAGGPEPQDGQPVGTVFLGSFDGARVHTQHRRFDGSPAEVVGEATRVALQMLRAAAQRAAG
jgi:nicotinamide-nucleotide amidase